MYVWTPRGGGGGSKEGQFYWHAPSSIPPPSPLRCFSRLPLLLQDKQLPKGWRKKRRRKRERRNLFPIEVKFGKLKFSAIALNSKWRIFSLRRNRFENFSFPDFVWPFFASRRGGRPKNFMNCVTHASFPRFLFSPPPVGNFLISLFLQALEKIQTFPPPPLPPSGPHFPF